MSNEAAVRIAVDRRPGHTRIERLDANRFVRPRAVHAGPDLVRVALVAACASLLAGDDVRLEVEVGPGAHLEIIEPSATVAYNGRGGSCRWAAAIRVAEGGSLVWAGAPLVVSEGADVDRSTTVELADGAVALHHETLVLGRSGEAGGRLRARMRATCEDRPLLVEDVDLGDPGLRRAPGILGENRVLATTALLGARPAEPLHTHETSLAGPGALARSLANQAHLTDLALAATRQRWQAVVEDRRLHRSVG
ncbi:urease accessory protein UreD [Nocardioides sp. JQ2195]|uniref:urease accessory protein UreD n=1 Tax=Nocardioides sp. JQ2195 TaxID=2592334 RepID=UPI00143E8438|nr:urease accessory protein UreD [Nocardioides sp. JQ2195]QIX27185.1 urease accessory protein UreD [Nocardioides sp. JQ2195]